MRNELGQMNDTRRRKIAFSQTSQVTQMQTACAQLPLSLIPPCESQHSCVLILIDDALQSFIYALYMRRLYILFI